MNICCIKLILELGHRQSGDVVNSSLLSKAFALALVNQDITITGDGMIYKARTELLSIQFDCTLANLMMLHYQLRDKSIVHNCTNNLRIPIGWDGKLTRDFIETYGGHPISKFRSRSLTFFMDQQWFEDLRVPIPPILEWFPLSPL